jgi:tRNA(fMet)-specific endonuclease VapC
MRMNGSYLLDTNIVIALFAKDANVLQKLSVTSQIFIPSIVLGELYYGANLTLVSRDQHFRSIKEIKVEQW